MDFLKSDENIEEVIKTIIEEFKEDSKKTDIYSEVLDPFSSMIEASINQLNYESWIKAEESRQKQKTLQNSIGNLHQKLLANIRGVEDLGVGEVVDIVCKNKKIIAEIKNKHNTTKGNHKKEIYKDIKTLLETKYNGYTGYYVEIIPKKPIMFNEPFVPSDNAKNDNIKERKDIRKIDGKSFYALLTEDAKALEKMQEKIVNILKEKYNLQSSEDFNKLFLRAYDIQFYLKENNPIIKEIEEKKEIVLIENKQTSVSRKLQWKHGDCVFKATVNTLKKENFKCPICKNKL